MQSDDDDSESVNPAKNYRRSIRRLKTKNLEMKRLLRDKDREIDALKLRCRETELPNAHPPEKKRRRSSDVSTRESRKGRRVNELALRLFPVLSFRGLRTSNQEICELLRGLKLARLFAGNQVSERTISRIRTRVADVLLWQQEVALIDCCRTVLSSDCGLLCITFTFDETPVKIRQNRIGAEGGRMQTTGCALLNQIASVYYAHDYLDSPASTTPRELIANDARRESFARGSEGANLDSVAGGGSSSGNVLFRVEQNQFCDGDTAAGCGAARHVVVAKEQDSNQVYGADESVSSLASTDRFAAQMGGTGEKDAMRSMDSDRLPGGPGRRTNNMPILSSCGAPCSIPADVQSVETLRHIPIVSPPVIVPDTTVPSLIDGCHANPAISTLLSLKPTDAYSVQLLLTSGDGGSSNAGVVKSMVATCGVSGSEGHVSPRWIPAHFPCTPHIVHSIANWSFRSADVACGDLLRVCNWMAYGRNLVKFRRYARLRPNVQSLLSAEQFDSVVNELVPTSRYMSQVEIFAGRERGCSAAVTGGHFAKLQRRLEKLAAMRGELRRALGHISGPLEGSPFSERLLMDFIRDYVMSRSIPRPLKSRWTDCYRAAQLILCLVIFLDFGPVFAACLGYGNRGVATGFDKEVGCNDSENSKSDSDGSNENDAATVTRGRREKMIDYIESPRFVGDLLLVALNPLSLGMGDALRARFGVLGVCGLVSNLREEVGSRLSPGHDVTKLQTDLAQALLPASGGGGSQFAARLRNSLIATSAGLTMRFDFMNQWPWRVLAAHEDAGVLREFFSAPPNDLDYSSIAFRRFVLSEALQRRFVQTPSSPAPSGETNAASPCVDALVRTALTARVQGVMKAWLSLQPVSVAGVEVKNSHANRFGSKFAKAKNASTLCEKMVLMEAGQLHAVRAKDAFQRARPVNVRSTASPTGDAEYLMRSDLEVQPRRDTEKERRRERKDVVRPSRHTSWTQYMASRGTNCKKSSGEWADLGYVEKQIFVEMARNRRVVEMLSGALSLVNPPPAARYQTMWGCDDVNFPVSVGYLHDFERLQAAGTEPHQTIWACRRAESRKRGTDHMGDPRTLSKAEADVTRKLKLSGEIRRATSPMAQSASRIISDYMIDVLKLPADRPGAVLLIHGCPGGIWGFDVAYIYGRTKDAWGCKLRFTLQRDSSGERGRVVTLSTLPISDQGCFGVSSLAKAFELCSPVAKCPIAVSIIQKSKCLVVDLRDVKFFLRKQVCRNVVNFAYGQGDHSVAYEKDGPGTGGARAHGVADCTGMEARAEIAESPSNSDAPSVVAELATQSIRTKRRYEDTRPLRRKTRIFPSEPQLRTPAEFFRLSRIRSRNWVVAEWQLIDENSIKQQNVTFFPRFNREKSISVSKVGGWEVVALALIQIWMWMSLMSEKGPDVATEAFVPCGGAEAVFSFAGEVVRLRGNVKARQLLTGMLREVEQLWPEWVGRLTASSSAPKFRWAAQNVLGTTQVSSDTDDHDVSAPSSSGDDNAGN